MLTIGPSCRVTAGLVFYKTTPEMLAARSREVAAVLATGKMSRQGKYTVDIGSLAGHLGLPPYKVRLQGPGSLCRVCCAPTLDPLGIHSASTFEPLWVRFESTL